MKAVRAGICACLAFAVLAHGAVEPWSEALLVLGAALLFLLWGVAGARQGRIELHGNALYLPMLVFGAIAVAQFALGLSVYAYVTKVELLKHTALFLLFFLAVQSFRSEREVRGFVWFLLVFGFAVALFAVLQHLTWNGKLYWFREVAGGGTSLFGPYVNRNHFAGLMELIVPTGLALLFFRGIERDQLPLVAIFTIMPFAALFLSTSRGGILSFLFELGLLVYLIRVRARRRRSVVTAAVLALVGGGVLVWLGMGPALERFRSEEVSGDRRVVILKDSWRIFRDHPALGTGLGTFATGYPQYGTYYDGRTVDHAHNDYLELMVETGVAGALCVLGFVVLLFRGALVRLQEEASSFSTAVRIGALVACAGLVVHSLVDFNLHIPSNALLFLLQAHLATADLR